MGVGVMVDLGKPLKSGINIMAIFYMRNIPMCCFGCGRVGHLVDNCEFPPEEVEVIRPENMYSIPKSPAYGDSSNSSMMGVPETSTRKAHGSVEHRKLLYGPWLLAAYRVPIRGKEIRGGRRVSQTMDPLCLGRYWSR